MSITSSPVTAPTNSSLSNYLKNIIQDWTSVKLRSYFFYFSVFLLLIVKSLKNKIYLNTKLKHFSNSQK